MELLKKLAQEHQIPYMDFYGVGQLYGGVPPFGTESSEKVDGGTAGGDLFASTRQYFQDVENSPLAKDLPVVRGSLLHHASGCYAANSAVKRANRLAENALLKAEKFHLLAQKVTGCGSARERLKEAWEKVLFNQFHDILAGCSIT